VSQNSHQVKESLLEKQNLKAYRYRLYPNQEAEKAFGSMKSTVSPY
jgi:hypothetical protein